MRKKVLLGMSGGVDSSVSAILLQKQGYEVIGATMRLWENENNSEDNVTNDAIRDAKKICEKLGIEHHVIDLREEFKKRVIDNFICSYQCAKTPNPCIECNKYIKFKTFYRIAQDLECEYMATGHYARIEFSEKYNQYILMKSKEEKKDQTYFLYGIDKTILSKVIFPLSEFKNKEEIRKIAQENGLEVANKKDSQEVCFIPNNDYISFLKEQNKRNDILKNKKLNLNNQAEGITKRYINAKDTTQNAEGNIILTSGEIVGKHTGLINYTIGQRKGLGISYKEPLYVLRLDKEKNQVIVGIEKELYSTKLTADELNFLLNIDFSKKIEVKAKIRYRAKEAEATLEVKNNIANVNFKEPQRAVTPGQSVVFYIDDIVLGGGKIL